ncbi:cell division protein FtsQ/DivIB [Methylocapsa palsarum]|uniref:cell division protein FtsQ/DivIB n=1 Tax=Methylocapsa palsarum TaxID=1612308 RepID=UPI001FCDEE90|nr:cell division protein FtsQ/DivIB [Methylocapsa palsarum]
MPGFAPVPFSSAGSGPRGASAALAFTAPRAKARPRARRVRSGLWRRAVVALSNPAATFVFISAVFLGAGAYGAVRGGEYDAFIAENGAPADIAARVFGFGIEAVTITGQTELSEAEVLGVAEIGPRSSLPFLDVAKVRERLEKLALVKEASVTKLYPDRLLIEIEERQPFALWQKDGHVNIVASDGTPLDLMRDQRFVRLPLVVGPGANEKLGEYLALLEAAGDMRDKIQAGILVSGRRWTLKMTNGIDVYLPEFNPAAAMASLVRLQRDSHVLEKDVLSLDLRQPDRMIARLTEDSAAARAETFAHKTKTKGGQI